MFFPERIKRIKKNDKVLEIGPGGSAYERADVLLEKRFSTEVEAEGQRGYARALITEKKLFYYNGGRFPFEDMAFDYVVCSHVLEHVSVAEIPFFLTELSRIAPKGYLEFPTVYYEYIYNFPAHVSLLLYQNEKIYFFDKRSSGLDNFSPVHTLFYNSLKAGCDGIVTELKQFFFQGFEWERCLLFQKAISLNEITLTIDVDKIHCSKTAPKREKGLFRRIFRLW